HRRSCAKPPAIIDCNDPFCFGSEAHCNSNSILGPNQRCNDIGDGEPLMDFWSLLEATAEEIDMPNEDDKIFDNLQLDKGTEPARPEYDQQQVLKAASSDAAAAVTAGSTGGGGATSTVATASSHPSSLATPPTNTPKCDDD
ncbi:MAG: hypothetical protein Q9227_009267, partial [Pyrenula ochraceoflavens]